MPQAVSQTNKKTPPGNCHRLESMIVLIDGLGMFQQQPCPGEKSMKITYMASSATNHKLCSQPLLGTLLESMSLH